MKFSLRERILFAFLVLGLACTVLTQSGLGQMVSGSIFGTVTDSTGAAIPNAKVTITSTEKNVSFEVATNEVGNFTRGQLVPGIYQVVVEAAGFRTSTVKDITVSVDTSTRVDLKVEVGNVSEQVEVTAEAPLLKSDRADVSTTFTGTQLNELPNFNRNAQSYLLLAPGAQRLGWNHASSENPQGSLQIQVNGNNFSGTGYLLDGTDNQDPILGIIVINPTIESIGEVKFTSQNYDAEFGTSIAGVFTTQTRSGTNELHGSLFEYFRNNSSGFQDFARNPFNSAENNSTPPTRWNQFGGSFGGKIKRDKLFYFADVQRTTQRNGSTVLTSVPTDLAKTGDFSQYLSPLAGAPTSCTSATQTGCVMTTEGNIVPLERNMIFDPLSGDPVTGAGRKAFQSGGVLNKIPSTRLSPQALAFYTQLPGPNAPGTSGLPYLNNFAASGSEKLDQWQWNTRGDYYLSSNSSIFGRYSFADFDKHAPGAFGTTLGGPALDNINFAGLSGVRNQSVAIGFNHTFSPTKLNETRFGYQRYRVNVLPENVGTSPAKDAGIPGLNNDPFYTSGMPAFYLQGDGGFNFGYSLGTNQCNCPLNQDENVYQIVDNFTWIKNNHNFKFGADLRYATQLRVPSDSHRAGELTFAAGPTGYVDVTNGSTLLQGLGSATFLLGDVTSFTRYVSPVADASERQKRFYWYAQDTWRITPKLTLNYGLRWEQVFPEKVNAPGNGGQLDLRTGEIAVFGVGQVSDHGIQDMNWRNFAPRFGISYQLKPHTVVRAGYGWSYAIGTFGSIFGHNVTQNLPVLANQSLPAPNNFSSVFNLSDGPRALVFPKPDANGRFPNPEGINSKARPLNLKMPYVMAYNVSVQHQISNSMTLEVAYVGNQGRNAFNGDGPNFNVNQAWWDPALAGNQNARKPYYAKYGWDQSIDFYCSCATTKYDALQVQFERRMSKGYYTHLSYTWGKGMQDSGDSYTFLYDRPLGRKITDFDIEHSIAWANVVELPVGKGRWLGSTMSRPADAILGGWNVNFTYVYYAGVPFSPSYDAPPGNARPDVGPSGLPDRGSADPFAGAAHDRSQWFVGGLGQAFVAAPNNEFGNYGQNTLRGPSYNNVDAALEKTFKFTERVDMKFRAEAYNFFNHTNLGNPNANVTSPTAGQITGLYQNAVMRRLQFGLRLGF